jgi:hypothetical protein
MWCYSWKEKAVDDSRPETKDQINLIMMPAFMIQEICAERIQIPVNVDEKPRF